MSNFITFEGGEGAGKSTQIQKLKKYLISKNIDVFLSREPGGTSGAEEIRDLVVQGNIDRWDSITEVLLINAARHDHVEKKIKPALNKKKWVLCDRFADSTTVYQGYISNLKIDQLKNIYDFTCGETWPDLTFIFDIDPIEGLKRAYNREHDTQENRIENMGLEFHKKIRKGFLKLAKNNPDRCIVIDASQSPEIVFSEIKSHIDERYFNVK